ncbi:MAG TPA: PAS domain-containing protein [bacterium]|nr:PAS domain-containing protein [bacterium]
MPNGSEVRNDDRFEERFRRMVDDSPAILWAFDEVNGRMIYVNPAVEEALGYDREKFYDRSTFWLELIHPGDRARVSAANHVMRTEKKVIRYEVRLRLGDGGYVRLNAVVKPILDERGNIVRTEGAAIPEYE